MPIAVWCLLVAGVLPVLTTGLAKAGAPYDNHQPFFAAAVLAAQGQDAPQLAIDMLALLYVAARIAYTAAYVADRPTLRSILWSVGFLTVVAIFTAPLWA